MYSDLGSDTSSVWNFRSRSSEVVSREKAEVTSRKLDCFLRLRHFKLRKTVVYLPSLSPPGLRALLSPGHVFLFAVIEDISKTFSTRAPSIP